MEFWKGKNVLVSGCSGFVGSWLVKALIDRKAHVVGLVRDMVPDSSLAMLGCADKIKMIRGDVEDYTLIERALNEYRIDLCFHLAAQSQVKVANDAPLSTLKTNILGTINILEASRKLKTVKAIIVASSDKAYGFHNKLPYREEFELKGTYPYDVSKACAEMLSRAYYNTYGLHMAIARCGNVIGPCDLNLERIVPDTIRSLCMNKTPTIRSDGKYLRDYIFVEDVVSAYLMLGEALFKRKKCVVGEAFNFGTGKPVTVIDLVYAMIKIAGKKIKPKILNMAKGEIKKQYLSSNKAKVTLGWMPRYNLKESLEITYKWYEEFFKNNA